MPKKQKSEGIPNQEVVQMVIGAALRYFDEREVEKDIEQINGGDNDKAVELLQKKVLEKVDGQRDFEDVTFLSKGAEISKAVGRIYIYDRGYATGNLIAENVIITNHHVFEDRAWVDGSNIEFFYELGMTPISCPLDATIFHNNKALDYAIVGVDKVPLKQIRPIILNDDPFKVMPGEYVYIIQHPNGGLKKVVFRNNKILSFYQDKLQYNVDTEGGSSGSFLCRADWVPIGLHHTGQEVRYRGDPTVHAVNEAIRISAICEDLKANGFGHLVS